MPSKSKKHASNVGKEAKAQRKKEKRKNKKTRDPKKDQSAMKSIKQSIRNKFQRIKGSGRRGQQSTASNDSIASSVASAELDDLVFNPPKIRLSTPKAAAKTQPPLHPTTETKQPSVTTSSGTTINAKVRGTTPKKSREDIKLKEKKELPVHKKKKPTEKAQKKQQQRKEKPRESRPKRAKAEKKKDVKKNKKISSKHRERREYRKEFRSFSDSSDYSDTDFDGSYSTDASSAYSDPGFAAVSYNDSDSGFDSDSVSDSDSRSNSSHSSDSSGTSYTSEGITMRTERSAWKRNPENTRGRSPPKPRRKHSAPVSGHISSPRSSPRKNDSNHIRSPRRSARGGKNTKKRFFANDDESDESSYASGTSYGSSESESDASNSSGSSYSDSESETNDEYYTTSFDDDPRNLRDATFSSSWTDRPLSTYGSEGTEFTKPREYPTLLEDISSRSMENSRHKRKNQSSVNESKDLGSLDENDCDDFVKEQEAAEKVEKERVAAKKEIEDQQGSGGGVFSWIFGGKTESEIQKTEEKEERGEPTSPNNNKIETKQIISSPPNSPRSSQSQQSIRSPRSPKSPVSPISPRSAASSRKDFILRDRRSAIISDNDQPDEIDPALSPGCSVNLDQILLGGDSMPGSYGGLKDGEFLLSDPESRCSNKEGAPVEELSVTMRGSGTFEDEEEEEEEDQSDMSRNSDAPIEIAFSPQSPGVTSPLSKSGRAQTLKMTDEGETETPFLFCCGSPENSIREDLLPSPGKLGKEFNRLVAPINESSDYDAKDDAISALVDDEGDVEDRTCASTIHTAGFHDLTPPKLEHPPSSSDQGVDGEKELQYFMVPANATEEQQQSIDVKESSSCAERIEIELGPYTHSSSFASNENSNTEVLEEHPEESYKRIKAESLDDLDVSEIVHGRKSYKSKTDDDGLPIPVSGQHTVASRRERRKKALEAHRDFLYKSHSIDTNGSTQKEGADDTEERSRSIVLSDSAGGIYGQDGVKTSPGGVKMTSVDNSSSAGPSVLSNSIVQDDAAIGDNKPDALIELVRNAFHVMISPKDEEVDNKKAESGAVKTNQDEGNSNPMEDVLEVAYRFFVPKQEASPLINESQEDQEKILECRGFNPNPRVRSSSIAESKEATSTEATSSTTNNTNLSNEAVLRNSRPKTQSSHNTDDRRFNADGIPLTLRPKKIWRAFDSGFSVSQSVVTTGTSLVTGEAENSNASTEPKSNHHASKDQTFESPSKLQIEVESETKETSDGMRLSTSPRYRRRAEMKRLKTRRMQEKPSGSEYTTTKKWHEDGGSELSPRKPASMEERRDATAVAVEERGVDRAPPSPTPISPEEDNIISARNNISDIRSRIKQRQRSKFRMQQQQQQQKSPKASEDSKELKREQLPAASSEMNGQVGTTDRRDDSFSEFFDAITFDDMDDEETKPEIDVNVTSPGKYMVSTKDERDQGYPGLSHKESILSGAMSLD